MARLEDYLRFVWKSLRTLLIDMCVLSNVISGLFPYLGYEEPEGVRPQPLFGCTLF